MKTYRYKSSCIFIFTCVLLALLPSFRASAHFGSKGPFGGTVSCITIFDTTVYIGTAAGGVYSSTSSKLTGWKPIPVGLNSGHITALAHTGVDLYAATDAGVFVFNGYDQSANRYWIKVTNGLSDLNVTSLAAINATTLLAGTATGLFLTTNSGASWQAVNGDLHHPDVTGIEKAGSRIFITIRDGGVYATDNNGTTWMDLNDSNTDHTDGTDALSYNSTTDQLLVLNAAGLFIAEAAGTASSPVFVDATADLPTGTVIYSISNSGTQWYLSTNNGVFTSPTSSISWTALNSGLTTAEVKAIEPFKTVLICGTVNKGIFKAALPFNSWVAVNVNFNNVKTTAMYTSGALFVVAATENGVYVSNDLAANYTTANKGLVDSLHVNDLTMAGSLLFAATVNAGVYVTADSGKNWSAANTGLPTGNIKKLFCSNTMVYAIGADNTIYCTSAATISWTAVQTGLPTGVVPTSMAFYGNPILLGTLGHGVFIKNNSATSWTAYNSGLQDLRVTAVTAMGSKIYAGTDGSGVFVSDSARSSLHWSPAAATTIWHTTTMNLDGSRIQAMAAYAGYVWASYEGGLLASSDQGNTWIAGGTQFNLPSYTSVTKISFVTTRVFVSTENNGLYSNALSEIPAVATGIFTAAHTGVVHVTPNPNQGTFRLDLSSVHASISEIIVSDYSGTERARFTSAQDLYSVHYTQGMYIVQIKTTDDMVYTQKMIIE